MKHIIKVIHKRVNLLVIILSVSYINLLNGQISAPPDPCTNGTQNTCQCETSPLLCSMDVLNGYSFQMTNYLHPGDGPGNPMCIGGFGTTAHNPTWFRFVAWCENIDLSVFASNCNFGGSCNARGVQLAVFPECNWQNPNNAVACEVNGCIQPNQGPPWEHTINLNMTGLIIGETYSMVFDGCCNSACLITITVTSPPCVPEIASWPGPIQGNLIVPVGSTQNYEVETPTGGMEFAWSINGVPTGDTTTYMPPNTSTGIDVVWGNIGTYQLCVDASNLCVPYGSNPLPNCIYVTVTTDIDSDGIPDIQDNCINDPNTNQIDTDNDGLGDACDNCPNISNPDQMDCDNNGIGNVCDEPDSDCDGIPNLQDNCPLIYNPFQVDLNQNAVGDACEFKPIVGVNTNNLKTELQVTNGSLFIDNPEKGIIMKDNLGHCYKIRVVNNQIELVPLTCP